MEVYIDDMIVKSKIEGDNGSDLRKTFDTADLQHKALP